MSNEQTREQRLYQLIEELFDIAWSGSDRDALWIRYQVLLAEERTEQSIMEKLTKINEKT